MPNVCSLSHKLHDWEGEGYLTQNECFDFLCNLCLKHSSFEEEMSEMDNKCVFGPKRVEVTGEWRKLHNEELNDLYSLPNIMRVVKSRRMSWAGHVARMGEDRRGAQGVGG